MQIKNVRYRTLTVPLALPPELSVSVIKTDTDGLPGEIRSGEFRIGRRTCCFFFSFAPKCFGMRATQATPLG